MELAKAGSIVFVRLKQWKRRRKFEIRDKIIEKTEKKRKKVLDFSCFEC